MSLIKLTDLPVEMLLEVFSYFKPSEILPITETCSKFNDVIKNTSNFIENITLRVPYPREVNRFVRQLSNSTRIYKNLKIERTCTVSKKNKLIPGCIAPFIVNLDLKYESMDDLLSVMMIDLHTSDEMANLSISLGNNRISWPVELEQIIRRREISVKEITQECVDMLKQFISLQSLKVEGLSIIDAPEVFVNLSNLSTLKELYIKRCNHHVFEFFSTCKQITKLTVYNALGDAFASNFEDFIISQRNLKQLKIEMLSLFETDRLCDIKSKLNYLEMKNVYDKNLENVDNFFKTQNELQTIIFQIHGINLEPESNKWKNILKTGEKHIKFILKKKKTKIC